MPLLIRVIAAILLSVVVAVPTATGQSVLKGVAYSLEAGTFLASGKTNPFWIRSNQNGEIPLNAQGFTFRAQVKKDYATLPGKRLAFGYGVRAVVNAGTTNQLILSEVYGKLRYGAIEFSAGRRHEIIGLADSLLSAGSYIWSGNALPLPKVEISIPTYAPILKNGLIAVKGNYAHGWFGTGDSVKNYYLHQKSFYVRLGKPNWRFKMHGGLNHQVQWGGTLLFPRIGTGGLITRFGSDLNTYWYVISAKSLYAESLVVQNGTASAEGGNRVGNHLGTFDVGLEYEDEQTRWMLYRQSIYEDGSLYYLNNIADGLLGISMNRKQAVSGIQRIVVEYLHTSNQGGNVSSGNARNDQLRGADDYFNNGRYIDGWVYKGQTIGTPFIMPLRYTTGLSQSLTQNPNLIVNNRVNALTIGVKSRVRLFDLVTRLSMSQNLGNYDVPLDRTQMSVQQQITVPVKQYTLTTTIAYDNAGVLIQNVGVSLLARRSF